MIRRIAILVVALGFGCSEPQELAFLDELVDAGADAGTPSRTEGPITGSPADAGTRVDGGDDGGATPQPCSAGVGEVCAVGQGSCERAGAYVCRAGVLACDVEPGMPADELCATERDEDCDGQVDEAPESGCCRHEDCAELELCSRAGNDALAPGKCESFIRPHADCSRDGDKVTCTCQKGYDEQNAQCIRNACVPLEGDAAPCAANEDCAPMPDAQKTCSCVTGYDDCDKQRGNGCEQPLNVRAHCGACGTQCDARASCSTAAEPRCACDAPLIGDGLSCLGYGPISAGNEVTCGIRAGGTIECFPSSAPTPPSGAFKQLALGDTHHCALKADGSVACWGTSSSSAHVVPVTPENKNYVQVVVGQQHTCALKSDGTPVCWGISQTNAGSATDYSQSKAPGDVFVQLAAGTHHNCGLHADGSVRCWGAGAQRAVACGDGNSGQGSYDCGQAMPPDQRFVQLTAGQFHSCGLRADGVVVCWGAGEHEDHQDPEHGQILVPSGQRFTFISAGTFHTCGVRVDKKVSCWGAGTAPQMRLPADFAQSAAPAVDFLRVAAGLFHTCGLSSINQLRCWGGIDPERLPQTATTGYWPVNP